MGRKRGNHDSKCNNLLAARNRKTEIRIDSKKEHEQAAAKLQEALAELKSMDLQLQTATGQLMETKVAIEKTRQEADANRRHCTNIENRNFELRNAIGRKEEDLSTIRNEVCKLNDSVTIFRKKEEESRTIVSSIQAEMQKLRVTSDTQNERFHAEQNRFRMAEMQIKNEKQEHEKILMDSLIDMRQKIEEKHKKEAADYRKKIEELTNQLPHANRKLKPFQNVGQRTKNQRFEDIVGVIKNFVGNENVDAFLTEFIMFVSKSEDYTFRLTISPWESFVATTKWQFSDSFLKGFKAFLVEKLHFDVFSSREDIIAIRNKLKPEDDYTFTVEKHMQKTKKGKLIEVSTVTATANEPEDLLVRRLENLAEHDNLQEGIGNPDEIVLGVGGDQGGGETKLAFVIGNTKTPNNPRNLLLLGKYTGHDDHKTMKEKFGAVFDKINKMKTVTYRDKGVLVTKTLKIVPLGDCKFISALFNHSGQSSSFPCFLCNASWSTHGKNAAKLGTHNFDANCLLRTLAQFQLEGDPLLHVDPQLAGPPEVHTFLGVVQTYVVDWLVALAIRYDSNGTHALNLKNLRKLAKQLKKDISTYEARIQSLRKSISLIESAQEVIENRIVRGKSRKYMTAPCGASFCFLSCSKKSTFPKVKSFGCSTCKKQVHGVCSLFFTSDEEEKFQSKGGTCLECRYKRPVQIPEIRDIVDNIRETVECYIENDSTLLEDCMGKSTDLENQLSKSCGPTRQRLEQAFRSSGCDGRVWVQELNGNQARSLLRPQNIKKLSSVFPPSQELDTMMHAMECLAFLMSECDTSLKTDEEIDKIESVLKDFITSLRTAQPDAGVTPKIHLLVVHLVPFLRENRSWGRLTEQGIESLHGVINRLNDKFVAVRDPLLKSILIIRQLSNFNLLCDTGDL